jgi:hypothetical protein
MQLPTKQTASGTFNYVLVKDLPDGYADVIKHFAEDNNRLQETNNIVSGEPAFTYDLYSTWFDHMRKFFFANIDWFVRKINY